jgi:hypothetical protein
MKYFATNHKPNGTVGKSISSGAQYVILHGKNWVKKSQNVPV